MQTSTDILITEGMHRHASGVLLAVDCTTTIPFASIQLYGASGKLLKTRFALVPLKYCVALDDQARAMLARIRALRLQEKRAARAQEAQAGAAFVARFAAAQARFLGLDGAAS